MQSFARIIGILGLALAIIFISVSAPTDARSQDAQLPTNCSIGLDAEGSKVAKFALQNEQDIVDEQAAAECFDKLQVTPGGAELQRGKRLCCWGGSCKRC